MVLIFDRDASVRELMRLVLADAGMRSVGAATPQEALVRRHHPALMIIELPHICDDGVVRLIDSIRHDPVLGAMSIIVSSTNPHLLSASRAWLRERRCQALSKPFDLDEFLCCVAAAAAVDPGPAAANRSN